MGMIVGCYGEKGNFLESLSGLTGATGLAGGVPIIVTNEDSLYPRANLYDGLVANPFKFGAIAADCQITVDLNIVNNAGAELGATTGWTLSGSSPTSIAAGAGREGTYAFRINTNNDSFYQVVYLRAGCVYRFSAAAFGGGGAVSAGVSLTDLRNGQQLNSSGAWVASANFIARTTASFATTGPVSFTVPAFGTSRWDLVPVQIQCAQTGGAGTVYFDSLYLWPAVDFVSVHGHNIQPNLTVELRRDTAAFAGAGTLIQNVTPHRPSFYASFAQTTDRYLRLKLTGTVGLGYPAAVAAIGPTYIGELVVSQKQTMGICHTYGSELDMLRAVQQSGSGLYAFISDVDERRVWSPSFDYDSVALYKEGRDLMRRSAIGGYNMVVVPSDSDAEVCMYGRVRADGWKTTHNPVLVQSGGYALEEQPFPTFVA